MKAELHFRKIFNRFIRLINETLKCLPFNLVMAPVIFFYFLLLIVSSLILFMNGNSQTCQKKCFLSGYI